MASTERPGRRRSAALVTGTALALCASLLGLAQPASAQDPDGRKPIGAALPGPTDTPADDPSAIPERDRAKIIGKGWKTSGDRAWTTTSDSEGFHLLVADAKSGYAWRTAASLSEPGFDTDMWIGNACVTGSGQRAVVVYGPRTFTNKGELFTRGGFSAVVDLTTGAVRKLPVQTSLAYYNPGCGNGESAALTQGGVEDKKQTRLIRLDTATGKLGKPVTLAGQVTSAIPLKEGGFAAADAARVVRVTDKGARSTLAPAGRIPLRLSQDAEGAVVFMDRGKDGKAKVSRVASGEKKARTLATGAWGELGLVRGAQGRSFITGAADSVAAGLPATVERLKGAPKDARVSTRGAAVVAGTVWADGKDARAVEPDRSGNRAVAVGFTVRTTGKKASFTVEPGARPAKFEAQGRSLSPAIGAPAPEKLSAAVASGSPTDPVEAERYCSVPRNDPHNQAMQPKPRQVEWAVDQAIMGTLNNHISRPAGWKNLGMPAYQPQTLFPKRTLTGGGHVPAQVMLGITAQESNMWQTSRVAVPGVTGNPLIGNYYGRDIYNDNAGDDWDINWADADCGYGVTQITDGMRLAGREKPGETAYAYNTQRAIALDYTVNVAVGVQKLSDKWNEVAAAGMQVNNGDWSKLENWYFAIWAYNSGFHPNLGCCEPWGVGWLNNPANPEYVADRPSFMDLSYADAAHPQDWPYTEKVLGFAGHPPELMESPGTMVAGFRAAWWNGDVTTGPMNRTRVKAPESTFCTAANWCDPSKINNSNGNDASGPCTHTDSAGKLDFKCWWTSDVTWKSDCSYSCGNELVRFDSTYAEQADGNPYKPNCSRSATASGNALPSNALVVDNTTHASARPADCAARVATTGSFTFNFSSDSSGNHTSKVDLHQLGAGFNGHFYFGHSRTSSDSKLEFDGTWSLGASRTDWQRVLVHLPDHGAHTQQAKYEIDTGSGTFTKTRYVNQKRYANNWVSLGVYKMSGVPRVRLTTQTDDGVGDDDVAFDAVAFQPLPGKPKHIVAVLGDSYASGEGAGSYLAESDNDHGSERWNACRRSKDAWGRKITLPGTSGSLGSLSDNWSTDAELGFVACSGAMTHNVWDTAWGNNWQSYKEGQFHEQAQARSGVLTADTTLVMLTLGGNDGGGFTGAMMECSDLGNCANDDNFLPKYKGKVDTMIPDLRTTLSDIRYKAPNAQIVLMGYPELLSRTVKCAGSWYIDMTEVDALAELVNYADGKQQTLVNEMKATGVKIDYANPVSAFVGHGGCDDPEWINKVVIGPNGDGDFHPDDTASPFCTWSWLGGDCLSRESFHPKSAGTTGYAGVMQTRLGQIGYLGS
ncbi:hypothetical protein [Streptomyces sp. NPDC048560]|uniref:golvesin C-terminal-like domain-containing protein n=1 Tax=Streptomyces sp. NPDC048560 TaxID=3155488 RepID=UPI00343E59EC